MLLIDAKHDRLGEAICLFKKVSQIPSDSFSPSFKGDGSLKIHCLILGIRYVAPVAVQIAFTWSPAGCVPFCDDAMYSIRREKTVFNTLSKTVSVDRIAEISIRVTIILAQWRCRSFPIDRLAGNISRSRANCYRPWHCHGDSHQR